MSRVQQFAVPLLVLAAAAPAQAQVQRDARAPQAVRVPALPDPTGWGVHVLALARGPDGTLWAGTYGQGIYVLRPRTDQWEQIAPGDRSVSWGFVHAFAFQGRDVWYGTVGNGWGVSRDGGRTWQNWTGSELGKRWLYVTPNGIVVKGDTVLIATADGITWTSDRGATWAQTPDTGPLALPNRYVLAVAPTRGAGLWVSTLRGVGRWDPSTGWRRADPPAAANLGGRIRAIFPVEAPGALVPYVPGSETCVGALRPRGRNSTTDRWECLSLFTRGEGASASIRSLAGCDGVLCAGATSQGALYGTRMGLSMQRRTLPARARDVYAALPPGDAAGDTLFGTACGLAGRLSDSCMSTGDTTGVAAPQPLRHSWLARPIALTDQPFIDQTYRYGSTMGGNFQQHQGVEFNNPAGTTVMAVESGVVVHAGPAEQGALTVAIRHDSMLVTPQGRFAIFSAYFHNSALLVREGQRVNRREPIARVGNTGRATNDHLHLEIHVAPAPADDVRQIVDPANRFPSFTRNPELWIEPLPGTGVVAGVVLDASGNPVRQARIYGIVKPQPQETPFSFAETYGDRARGDPAYEEHFAIGDVPPGEYVLGAEVEGRRHFRRIRVEAGRLTWVEFRP